MSGKREAIFRGFVIILVLGLVSVSLFGLRIAYAQAGQVTFKPTDDTYVDSSQPNSNYGGQVYLQIDNYSTQESVLNQTQTVTDDSIVWLKFDLSFVPEGAVIDEATLQLWKEFASETFKVVAQSCSDNSWTESALTYSNMPSYDTSSGDEAIVAGYNAQWCNWSIVDIVKGSLSSGSAVVTIVLREPSLHGNASEIWFASKEMNQIVGSTGSDIAPKLTIHWSEVAPEFPTFIILPFFMIATLIGVALYKKKAMLHKRL